MLLTVRDLARELQVKPSTLYVWVAAGKIPCVKLNGLIRFRREEITAWIASVSPHERGNERRDRTRRSVEGIDEVIARAKRQVYTPACGKPDQDRADGKEGLHGSV